MHFDSKPFRQTFGAEYIYLFDGIWQREDLLENSDPFEIIVLTFVNCFGAALQQRELPPRKLRIPPFPNFSFQITLTRESILLIFGQSASTSLRYARYIDYASQPPPTLESIIAECEGNLGWESCLGISFSLAILTNQAQRDEEVKKEAESMAAQFADQITQRKVVNDKLINLPREQNGSVKDEYLLAVEVFLCYAHKDQRLLNNLKTYLKPMLREGFIVLRDDFDISAGTKWEQEINEYLNTAQIILLLVSPDFMGSDYCYSIEMKRALERHERGEVRVVPIILRPTDWENTPLGGLQALPKDGKPITKWRSRDDAYLDMARGLRKVIEEMSSCSALSTPLAKQTNPASQRYRIKEEERVYAVPTGGVEEVLTKLRDELQRQREADNLLLEAHKFAPSFREKHSLIRRAIELHPPYKEQELRQLGIEMSIAVINGYDPMVQMRMSIADLRRETIGYWKWTQDDIVWLTTHAINYLRENVLGVATLDSEGLLYLACMYGYQQEFEEMIKTIEKAIKIDEHVKEKFQQRSILLTLLRGCSLDETKLERVRKRLGIRFVSKRFFCKFTKNFNLTNFHGFIEWIAFKRSNALGERGAFLIKITPPYVQNQGLIYGSALSVTSWEVESISTGEPMSIDKLFDVLDASFILIYLSQ